MTWCNTNDPSTSGNINISNLTNNNSYSNGGLNSKISPNVHTTACPSCGHRIPLSHHQQGGGLNNLPGLPAGVKFDPTDPEILGHLEAKVKSDLSKLHPLLDEFIPTIEGENGICYTHPEKLPGVTKDGVMRHFFHCPSRAYTTGTRKRRKVHTDDDGGETRWHKTGKTRPITSNGLVKGFKKILVLYTNYGRQKKAEKTNWVMHQYHLGHNEEERDGEYVVSKVFYQTQPRQCGSNIKHSPSLLNHHHHHHHHHPSFMSYDHHHHHHHHHDVAGSSSQLFPNFIQGDGSSLLSMAAARKS